MKKKLCTLFSGASLVCCLSVQAQKNDFGIWLGGANYFGDVNTGTDFRFVNPAGGFFYRRNFDERISARFNINGGRVWADDAYANNYYQQTRNLGFSSNIFETSVQFEFNFMPYTAASGSSTSDRHRFAPYVMAGFGVFHFNPSAKYNGEKVWLQPLGTEGQGYPQYPELKHYKRTSTAWLLGGGFKYRLSALIGLTLEGGVRKTSTDYLDDVSAAYADPVILLHEGGPMVEFLGDPSAEVVAEPVGETGKMRGDNIKSDDYFFFGVGISYTLKPYRCPYPH
ncbi:MAG: DUF6089 family protein [Chitinophagales bacterium]